MGYFRGRRELPHAFLRYEGGVLDAKKTFPALYVVGEGHSRLRGPTQPELLSFIGRGGGGTQPEFCGGMGAPNPNPG